MKEKTTQQKEVATVLEKCPFFLDEYGGCCLCCGHPYTPSISEREHYCFSKNPEKCPYYRVAEAVKAEA
jgi:hypothetical protein